MITCAIAVTLAACSQGSSDDSKCPSSPRRAVVLAVGNISVTVTPEAQHLAQRVDVNFRRGVQRTVERVDGLLHLSHRTPVSIEVNGARAIPEVGVGGFTDPGTGSVTMSLDPKSPIGMRATLRTWVVHGQWFFGTTAAASDGVRRIPHWAGYTIGASIVGRYLQDHPDNTPANLTVAPAELLLASAA